LIHHSDSFSHVHFRSSSSMLSFLFFLRCTAPYLYFFVLIFCILRYQFYQHNYSKDSHYLDHNNLCRHRVDTFHDDKPDDPILAEWRIPRWNCTSNRQVTAPVPGSEVPGSALRSACSCSAAVHRRCWPPYDNRLLRRRNTGRG